MDVHQTTDVVKLLTDYDEKPLLAQLVNDGPTINVNPKLAPKSLSELSSPDKFRTQEALVIHDLLNVLLGLEGLFVRYKTPVSESDHVHSYTISKHMDPALKTFCLKSAKLGQSYSLLRKFAEQWSGAIYGIVLQKLSYLINEFLHHKYLRFITERVEYAYINDPKFSIRELEQMLKESEIFKHMRLLSKFTTQIDKIIQTRQKMDINEANFTNFLKKIMEENRSSNDLEIPIDTGLLPIPKGGIIINLLSDFISENLGDRSAVKFLSELLNGISEEYCNMLHTWLTQGELNDHNDEFMIVDTMKDHDNNSKELYQSNTWSLRFMIRRDGLLNKLQGGSVYGEHNINRIQTLKEENLLMKILTTGKLLNIFKTCSQVSEICIESDMEAKGILLNFTELMEGTNMELYVNKWYERANELCLSMLYEGYNYPIFLWHLHKKFLGFQNVHKVMAFINFNINELTKTFRPGTSSSKSLEFKILQSLELLDNDYPPSSTMDERGELFIEKLFQELVTVELDKTSFNEMMAMFTATNPTITAMNDVDDENPFIDEDNILQAKNFNDMKDILIRGRTHEGPSNKSSLRPLIYHLQYTFDIPYPLNMVVNNTCMIQYKLYQRFIYLLYYHSKLLDDTWHELNKNEVWCYRGFGRPVREQVIKRARWTQMKMNHFTKSLIEYFTQDVIEVEISRQMEAAARAQTVVSLMDSQQESLSRIMSNCCFHTLLSLELQIMEIIFKFCKFVNTSRSKLRQLDPYAPGVSSLGDMAPYEEAAAMQITARLAQYAATIGKVFDEHLRAFVEGLAHFHDNQGPAAATMSAVSPSAAGGVNGSAATGGHDQNIGRLILALGTAV